MRIDIPLTELQLKKLKLLGRHGPGSVLHITRLFVYQALLGYRIRVCGAHRCNTEFIYRLRSPGRPKVYCCNACRVAQQYHLTYSHD